MEVFLSSPRGFCAGVVRAIEVVDICLERYGPPVYVKHQIVHNPHVVADLERKGAITVETLDQVPVGSLVVFSAHGSPPDDFKQAEERNLRVIDAVCPLGDSGAQRSQEIPPRGQEGACWWDIGGIRRCGAPWARSNMTLVDDSADSVLPAWDPDDEVAVLTQTTLSVGDTAQSIDAIKQRFPGAVVRNDICYATTNRQFAVTEMAVMVDLVLVIGAVNSSNCNRLREVAASKGVPSYLINGPEEIEPSWLDGVSKVGITSGASTPEVLVESVISALEPEKVTMLSGVEEDVSFTLPRELR